MLDKYSNVITRPKHDIGHCNICDSYEKLTEDHVPPKGSTRITQVKVLSLSKALDVGAEEAKGRYSQNGVKFKSLCGTCNNKYLGLKYDPSLNYLSNEIIKYIESNLALPRILHIKVKPNLIARAVLGHMLAIDIGRGEKLQVCKDIARYFLNPTYNVPKNIKLYYWVYPFKKQILMRDAIYMSTLGSQGVHFMLIKYFPLAFMATLDSPEVRGLNNLVPYLSSKPEDEKEIPVTLYERPPAGFPENPTDNGLVFFGDSSIGAIPKT